MGPRNQLIHSMRFGWQAMLAMVAAAGVAAFLNARLVITGFYNWRGLPIRWYTWSDYGPTETYYWWALVADALIALPPVLVVGLIVEFGFRRISRGHSK